MTQNDGWTTPGSAPEPAAGPPSPTDSPAAGGWGAPPGWSAAGVPPRPGIVPLRPLSLGELYDGAFQAVRTNPRAVLGISAVIVVILTIISTSLTAAFAGNSMASLDDLFAGRTVTAQSDAQLTSQLLGQYGSAALSSLLSLVATAMLSGVVTVAVSTAVIGRRTAAGALWQRVRGRLAALVGLALLLGLLDVMALLVCLLPGGVLLGAGAASGSSGTVVGGAVLLVVGFLAGLALLLVVDVRLFMAPPVLILEGQRVGASVRRAWGLSTVGFWRLLGVRLLSLVIVGITASVVVLPFEAAGTLVGHLLGSSGTGLIIGAGVGQALGSTFLYPLGAAVTALQYIDQRMRREGLDVELARAAAEPA